MNIIETLEDERREVEPGSWSFLLFLTRFSVADRSALSAIEFTEVHGFQPSSVEGRYLLPRGWFLRFLLRPKHLQREHFRITRIIVAAVALDKLSRTDRVRLSRFSLRVTLIAVEINNVEFLSENGKEDGFMLRQM